MKNKDKRIIINHDDHTHTHQLRHTNTSIYTCYYRKENEVKHNNNSYILMCHLKCYIYLVIDMTINQYVYNDK